MNRAAFPPCASESAANYDPERRQSGAQPDQFFARRHHHPLRPGCVRFQISYCSNLDTGSRRVFDFSGFDQCARPFGIQPLPPTRPWSLPECNTLGPGNIQAAGTTNIHSPERPETSSTLVGRTEELDLRRYLRGSVIGWLEAGELLRWPGGRPGSTAILTWPSTRRIWAAACRCSSQLGYAAETDWLPVRIELRAPGARWVDVHPVNFSADGHGRQPDLDGGALRLSAHRFHHGLDPRPPGQLPVRAAAAPVSHRL